MEEHIEAFDYLKKNEWTEEDLNGYMKNIASLMDDYAESYHQSKLKSMESGSKCQCPPEETTGTTKLDCCNLCGKQTEIDVCQHSESMESGEGTIGSLLENMPDKERRDLPYDNDYCGDCGRKLNNRECYCTNDE